jgi:hypothetical protein
MTGINLIPPQLLAQREARRLLRRWGARLATITLGLTLLYAALARVTADRLAEVDRATGRYTSLHERLQSAGDLVQERNRLAERRALIDLIRDDRTAGDFLTTLGSALTPDAYLAYLSLERCAGAESAAETEPGTEPCRSQLVLRGLAPGHQQVGETLRRLSETRVFSDVELVSIRDPLDPARAGEVEFEMSCTLDGAPADD